MRKFCSVKIVYVLRNRSHYMPSCRETKVTGSLKSIRLGESVFNLWTDRKEALGFSECTDSEFAE